MRVLLDTSALYVAAGLTELQFSQRVQRLLADPETDRLLSVTSVMEVAIKAEKGLTQLRREHVERAVADLRLTMLSFTAAHAYRLFSLPAHHRDPFDRMLIATALTEGIPIVSNDRHVRRYRGLRIIW